MCLSALGDLRGVVSRRPAPGRRRALALLAASLLAFIAVHLFLARSPFNDLRIYQLEGRAIVKGWTLYGHLPGVHGRATYPPFAAIVFAPTAALPLTALKVLNFALTFALLVWVSIAACRLAGVARPAATDAGLLLAAGALWCEPVFKTFNYGQINLLLLALVLWDFTRPETARYRGVGTGLAAAMKVTPGVFILYLLLTRRFRFALTALATFAATLALSAAIDLDATRRYWTSYLFDVERVGRLENAVNQTVRGVLVRIDHTRHTPPAQMIIVALVAAGGLTCAVLAYRRLGDRWGLPACAVTGLLASPIAWSHHWVWCVPIAALVWYRARPWIWPTVAVFWSYAVWAVPHANSAELHFSALQIALSGWYVLFGLAFLGLTAGQVRRAHPA